MQEEGEQRNDKLKRVWKVSQDLLALKRVVELQLCVLTGKVSGFLTEWMRHFFDLLKASLSSMFIRGQSIKKPNFFFFNLLLYLQLNQTCLLQSTPLHSWYTAPNVFSSSGTRPGTCFAGWREGPVSNFLLSLLSSEIGDLSMRISTVGTGKSPQGPNLESRAAGEQQSFHASSKIHG